MRQVLIIILIILLVGCERKAQDIILTAPSGEYQSMDIGPQAHSIEFTGRLTLSSLDPHAQWPPAAYAGFYQGENRNNSVQLVIAHYESTDKSLGVGYRVVVDGEVIKNIYLADINISDSVEFTMSYTEGYSIIKINSEPTIELETPFNNVKPYLSVSSGEAVFNNIEVL